MIGVVGLSHKSAPVNIREKFSFDKDEYTDLSHTILKNKYIDELVVISTCNRTELYFSAKETCYSGAFSTLINYLKSHVQLEAGIESHFYQYESKAAINHLFRVISGLESMVLGEYQIVSQIKDAISHAEKIGSAGKLLTRLFHKALETGKQVRTQTGISNGAFSVSYAAVLKCISIFENISDKKILLIGAGETGELVIKNLYKKGCKNIQVANRTYSKALELANQYDGNVIEFSNIASGIADADIVVSSISCKKPLVTSAMIENSDKATPTVFIDLGVPRNIDQQLAELDSVSLFNVDDLKKVVNQNKEKKESYLEAADKIIAEKLAEYASWLSSQNLSPVIQNMISEVTEINHKELEVFRKFHDENEFQNMEKYGKHITEKIVNSMIKNLKSISDNGKKTECIRIVNDLFSPANE